MPGCLDIALLDITLLTPCPKANTTRRERTFHFGFIVDKVATISFRVQVTLCGARVRFEDSGCQLGLTLRDHFLQRRDLRPQGFDLRDVLGGPLVVLLPRCLTFLSTAGLPAFRLGVSRSAAVLALVGAARAARAVGLDVADLLATEALPGVSSCGGHRVFCPSDGEQILLVLEGLGLVEYALDVVKGDHGLGQDRHGLHDVSVLVVCMREELHDVLRVGDVHACSNHVDLGVVGAAKPVGEALRFELAQSYPQAFGDLVVRDGRQFGASQDLADEFPWLGSVHAAYHECPL